MSEKKHFACLLKRSDGKDIFPSLQDLLADLLQVKLKDLG